MNNQDIFKSGFIYTLGDFLSIGISTFLLLPVYTKFLSPSEYGIVSLITLYSTFLGIILMIGLQSSFSRYYFLCNNDERSDYLSSIWLFQLLFSLFFISILFFFNNYISSFLSLNSISDNPYFFFIILNSFLFFTSGFYSIWLRLNNKPSQFLIVQISNTLILFISVYILVVKLKLGVLGVVISNTISCCYLSIVAIIGLKKYFKFTLKSQYLKPSLKFGLWMMIGTLSSTIINKIQLVYLGVYTSMDIVGLLNLVLQISNILLIFSVSFGKAWQPYIFSSNNIQIAGARIKNSFLQFSFIILTATLLIGIFSKEIVTIMAPNYIDAIIYLKLMLLLSMLSTFNLFPSTILLYIQKASINQISTIASAILSLLLNYFLIVKYKILGALFSMCITTLFNLVLNYYLSNSNIVIKYPILKTIKIFSIFLFIYFLNIFLETYIITFFIYAVKILLIIFYFFLMVKFNFFDYKYFHNIIKYK